MSKKYSFYGNARVGDYVGQRLDEYGWKRAEDGEKAEVAITYCTSMGALEDAYFDNDGIIRKLGSGDTVIDLSPATPAFARELSAMCAVSGVVCIEAPVAVEDPDSDDAFSSPEGLICYVAGEKDACDQTMPAIKAIAAKAEYVGEAGMGQLAKALATIQRAAHLLADIECEALMSAVSDSSVAGGWSSVVAGKMPGVAEGDRFGKGAGKVGAFTVEMLMGEVAAVLAAGEDVDLILPQIDSCMRLLEVLAMIGGVDMAPRSLALLYCDEETSVAEGLDWKRARNMYGDEHDDWDDDADEFSNWDDDADDGFDNGYFGDAYGHFSSN